MNKKEIKILHWAGENIGCTKGKRMKENIHDVFRQFHIHKMLHATSQMLFKGEGDYADFVILGEVKQTFFNGKCIVNLLTPGPKYKCEFIKLGGDGKKQEMICVAYNPATVLGVKAVSSLCYLEGGDRIIGRFVITMNTLYGFRHDYHVAVCHTENANNSSNFLIKKLKEQFKSSELDLFVGDTNVNAPQFGSSSPFRESIGRDLAEIKFDNHDEFPGTTINRAGEVTKQRIDRAFVRKGMSDKVSGKYFHPGDLSNHFCLGIRLIK